MLKRGVALLLVLVVTAAHAGAEPREAGQAAAVPDNYKLNILIRTTIIALSQANATGNYSVLRDLAAPSFQTANSQARLAEIFAALRGRKLDLSPILFFEPKLVQPAAVQPDGRLRLTGFFDTRPERVIFDLIFEQVEGDWRLFGLAIDVTPPEPAAAKAPPAAAETAKKETPKKETPKKKEAPKKKE